MSPVTHFLLSWSVASNTHLDRRDRTLVTLAGISPDLDGVGLLWDLATRQPGQHLTLWSTYHHILGHNITFGVMLALLAAACASRRIATGTAAFFVFHLHLFCDFLGSKGPDENWSIPYLLPFSDVWDFVWVGQWPLVSWQNFFITISALVFVVYQSWRQGFSPLEFISKRANCAFVSALRIRFGTPL